MTPEQKKSKEIVNKHYLIIEDATAGLFEEDVEYVKARQTAAKACAIEEVKAVINVIADLHIIADSEGIMKSMIYHEKVLTEIEKL